MENKEEKLQLILDSLDEAFCCDWDEAEEILNNLPEEFWRDCDYSSALIEKISEYFYDMDDYDFEKFIPDIFWENKSNVLNVIEMIVGRDIFNTEAIFPPSVWEDEDCVHEIVSNDYYSLQYVSDKFQNYKKIVFSALDNLEEQIEESYCNWNGDPWDKREYLQNLIDYISESLKSDKDFILEFLEYSYFEEDFDLLFDWIDEKLWMDQDFVIEVLNVVDIFDRIPDELKMDEEFTKRLAEELNIDLDII